jgi:uncharacterized protein YybS (DUF2232 family)
MIATVKIDLSNPQALPLLGYLESLPFAEVKKTRQSSKSAIQQALAQGAVTVDEFFDELDERIKRRFNA